MYESLHANRKTVQIQSSMYHRTAIVYDFDGTLARGNIQEHSFLPAIGIEDAATFWRNVDEFSKAKNCDRTITYLWLMLREAKRQGISITEQTLAQYGAQTPLFPGVRTWFERINEYAKARNLILEHYVISSGNQEIIAGCPIYPELKQVFASKYLYDSAGEALWPGTAINYTTKTQYLFRINKGVLNNWEDQRVNRWIPMEERPIPFTRMIFIGDGDTDIPSMKMVRYQGGFSVAVFDPERWEDKSSQRRLYRLISEDRVNFVAPADYQEGSQLEIIIKGIIGRFARDAGYRKLNINDEDI